MPFSIWRLPRGTTNGEFEKLGRLVSMSSSLLKDEAGDNKIKSIMKLSKIGNQGFTLNPLLGQRRFTVPALMAKLASN